MMSLLLVSLKVRAAALYGSNASNGALLVTTKEVSWRKMTVGFNSAFTAESAYLPKFQSQYGTGWKAYDAVENTNWGPRYDGTNQQVGLFLRATV
jgi:hypothetical protein